MKYLITEKQLKTLRKYMKSFINEGYDDNLPLGAAQDPRNPENRPYGSSEDDNTKIVIITHNGRKIAKVTIDFDSDEVYTDFYTNNQNINNSIEDKLDELKDAGMAALSMFSDNYTVSYQDLMTEY